MSNHSEPTSELSDSNSSQREELRGKKSVVQKWTKILKTVTVEPAAILLMTSTLMSYLMYQNLMIECICRTVVNQSEEVCKEVVKMNETYKHFEDEVQEVFAQAKIYRSIADNALPIFYVVFMGPWSDHYGRKIPLILPLVGFIVQNIAYLVFSLYYDSVSHHTINIVTALPRTFTGSETAYAMAAYSYICDITTHSTRTIRAGLLSSGILLGVPLGFALGGALIRAQVGYTASFGISIGILIVCLVILLLRVQNTTKADRQKLEAVAGGGKDYAQDDLLSVGGANPSCWTILNPKNNLVKVLSLPFVKREKNGRLHLWLLLLLFVCSASPIYGEFSVVYLFLRDRLNWDAVNYGTFSTYNSLIGVIGVILSMGIFTKWLKLSDPVVGFIAGTSQMSGSLIYAFATTPMIMYLAPTVDMMNGTMIVIARSMLSKLVAGDEIGKLFSLIAILETVVPLIINPLYTTLYHATIHSFSGYFFILSAVLTIPPQIIFLWFIIRTKFFNKTELLDSDSEGSSNKPSIPISEDDKLPSGGEDGGGGVTNLAFYGE